MSGCGGGLEFFFCCGEVLLLFSDLAAQIVGSGRVDCVELFGDAFGLVGAAADDWASV